MKNISKGTVIRTAVLVLAIINSALALFGKSPLPVDDVMIESTVSFLFVTGASLAGWWKDNDFTVGARRRKAIGRAVEAGKLIVIEPTAVEDEESEEELETEYSEVE